MPDLSKLRHAQTLVAEKVAIECMPLDLRAWMNKAQAEHEAKGGCPGCGSMVYAVHNFPNGRTCPTLKNDLY